MEVATPLFKPGSEGLLAPLEPWLNDASVSEILINRPQEVFIERFGEFERHEVSVLTPMHLKRLFHFIANENKLPLNAEHPLLSGNLYDGSRVQLVIPPTAKDYTLSIRRKSIARMRLADYQTSRFFNKAKPFSMRTGLAELMTDNDHALLELYRGQHWGEFLAKAVAFKKNIILSGETSSGKTSFLNALIADIPAGERLITLEDTFELEPPHANLVSLLAPKKTNPHPADITMQDLVQCAMRLRPDRIFMGEIRGAEVLDFINACATGHEGSLSTIHAGNPKLALMRMVQLYKLNNVPSMRDEDILQEIKSVVDIIVQLERRGGVRQIASISFKLAEI